MKESDIAAILLEPIVSVGGMMYPPAEWFREVRGLCDHYEVLLIFDECQTGFGRIGDWFAYQIFDVLPDIVATAKGIGLGFPVSAVLFRDKLIPQQGGYVMSHYSSHQNDPFAAAIINAGIQYIEEYQILSFVQKNSVHFLELLVQLEQKNPHLNSARGQGLMLGADLHFRDLQNYRSLYAHLYQLMMEKGVIIQGTNGGKTLRFLPDYLMKKEEFSHALEILHDVLLTKKLA